MEAGVFLLQGDNTLVRMTERPYQAESLLQVLLADHPDLLAGDQIDPSDPRRWILLAREAGVPATLGGADWWAVDHLFLDQDAIPTFVEVKRATDTRARREVVAQMLDYAANATEYWPVDRMRELFAIRCAARGIDPVEELEDIVGPEVDEVAYWDLAKANLREGRVRLLFVADHIPASLRRIVEFLNRQMNPAEVLAVEIRQFAPDTDVSLRTLVPRVIGQTEQARENKSAIRTSSRSTPASRDEFFEQLPTERRDARLTIVEIAESLGFIAAYSRTSSGVVRALISLPGVKGTPVTLNAEYLWVSLGRHHAALRDPTVNQEIRQAILALAPSSRQAEDPKKTEVAIPFESINRSDPEHLHALFGVMKRALVGS